MAGIDQILQNKINVGRQNPQALMQSYQQNQDLLDLLAMQKLKSEKEAAQRDMMLKAAQSGPPPTVVQQREQELVAMNKNEIAQQAAQAGQQQVAQQQAAMQSLLGSGIGQLPAPNMARMAGGGIVAFQEGGDVRPATSELRVQQLIEEGVSPEEAEAIANQERYQSMGRAAAEDIKSLPSALSPAAGLRSLYDLWQQKVAVPGQAAILRTAPGQFLQGVFPSLGEVDGQSVEEDYATVPEFIDDGSVGPTTEQAQPAAQEQLPAVPSRAITTRTAAPAQPATPGAPIASERSTPMDYLASVARNTEAPKPVAEKAGLSALQQEIARSQGQRDDKLRYLADFLTGAGGATNMAAAMRGGVSSARESQTAQDQAIRNLMAEQQGVELQREETAARREEAAADRQLRELITEREIGSRREIAELDADLSRELATMDTESRMAIEDLRASRELQIAMAEALAEDKLSPSDVTTLTRAVEERFMLMEPQLRMEFMEGTGLSERSMELPSNVQRYRNFVESKKAEAFRTMASGQSPFGGSGGTITPEMQEALSLYSD